MIVIVALVYLVRPAYVVCTVLSISRAWGQFRSTSSFLTVPDGTSHHLPFLRSPFQALIHSQSRVNSLKVQVPAWPRVFKICQQGSILFWISSRLSRRHTGHFLSCLELLLQVHFLQQLLMLSNLQPH